MLPNPAFGYFNRFRGQIASLENLEIYDCWMIGPESIFEAGLWT